MLKNEFKKHIRLDNNNNESKSIEDQWRNIKDRIHNAVEKILGYRKKVSRMDGIHNIMEERRFVKGNIEKYTHMSKHMSQGEQQKTYGW